MWLNALAAVFTHFPLKLYTILSSLNISWPHENNKIQNQAFILKGGATYEALINMNLKYPPIIHENIHIFIYIIYMWRRQALPAALYSSGCWKAPMAAPGCQLSSGIFSAASSSESSCHQDKTSCCTQLWLCEKRGQMLLKLTHMNKT